MNTEINTLTDEQKLIIDINRGWLKNDYTRSDAITSKVSLMALTNAIIFLVLSGLSIPFGLVWLLFGISFILFVFALSPITVYYDTWDDNLQFTDNNRKLCKNIEETRSNINKQCKRFNRAQLTFLIATVFFIICLL